MRAWSIVALVAALAVAAHATELEDKVAKTIADFKAMMPVGRADLNIPVLEPISIKQLPLSIKASPFNAKLVASDIHVAGASSFEVTELSQVGDSNTINIGVSLDGVDVSGDYDIHGSVKVGFLKVNLNGNGPLRISIKGVKGAGTADMLSKNNGGLHLNDMKITDWSYEKLTINLDNLFDGGVMGKTVNKLINKLVPTFASANHDRLSALLETYAKKYINKYLDGATGNSVRMLDAPVAQDWVITEEVQEILDQLAAVAVSASSDATADLETAVKDLSESFRAAMKKGNDEFDMAAMDPVVFSDLSVHFHKWLLDGQVLASDVQVSGASDFELTKVTALDANKVALEIKIPALSVQAGFALDAKINLGVKVHSKKTGTLGMTASDVKCTATAELVVDNDGQLRLASFDVNSWGYGKLNVHVENPTNTGFIKKSINSLVAKLVPSLLVKPHKDDLAAWASSSGLRVIGHFVDGVAGRIPIANLDERATTLLESLRSVMETGSKDLGLPVLDPFYLDELSFPVVAPSSISATVVAKNFKVSKNSYFIVSDVTQAPESNRVTFVLDVPLVKGSGSVDVSAVYAWPAGQKAASSGDLTAQIEDLKITASAVLAKNADGAFQLRQLTIDSWTYGEVAAKFALKDYRLQSLMNQDTSYALHQLLETQKAAINTWAETSAKAVLDQYLAAVALPAPLSVHLSVIPAKAREIILQLAALAA